MIDTGRKSSVQESIESVRKTFELKLNSLKEDMDKNLNDLSKRGHVEKSGNFN
jgi:hypothetical protein